MKHREYLSYVLLVVSTVALLLTAWIGHSHLQARAYQNVTGQHIATWDAMWLQLRVIEPGNAKGDDG